MLQYIHRPELGRGRQHLVGVWRTAYYSYTVLKVDYLVSYAKSRRATRAQHTIDRPRTVVSYFIMRPFFAFRQQSLFITGCTSTGCQKKKNASFCTRDVCVIQHRNWPLRSTILNAHGTNASPDGLCTRTHTNEAFSYWFCCNSFRVDRARRANVCL